MRRPSKKRGEKHPRSENKDEFLILGSPSPGPLEDPVGRRPNTPALGKSANPQNEEPDFESYHLAVRELVARKQAADDDVHDVREVQERLNELVAQVSAASLAEQVRNRLMQGLSAGALISVNPLSAHQVARAAIARAQALRANIKARQLSQDPSASESGEEFEWVKCDSDSDWEWLDPTTEERGPGLFAGEVRRQNPSGAAVLPPANKK